MSPVSVANTQTRRSHGHAVVKIVCCTAILITALAAIRNNAADPDLWGHVQYGREVLKSGTLPMAATWTFTSSARWMNHENISEVILAWVGDHGGAPGLGLMKLAITLMLFGLMLKHGLSRRVSLPAIAIVLVLSAECMQFHWHFRPHLFGFALFGAMIALLDWVFWNWAPDWQALAEWRKRRRHPDNSSPAEDTRPVDHTRPDAAVARLRWLWFGPVILCVWTNTHGGFAAGLAIWCAYLFLRIVEAWCSWGNNVIPLIKRLGMMLVAGILATLINPYGPMLHLWLAKDVWLPRPEISDWQPLFQFGGELWAFWALLVLAVCSFVRSRKYLSFTETIILGLVTWQALSHVRHALFFAILCGFWLPHRVSDLLKELLKHRMDAIDALSSDAWIRRSVVTVAVIWAACLCVPVARSFTSVAVDRSRYPVSAMQYLCEHKLYGRTVVAFNWAQYAIGCFASDPDGKQQAEVAVDGRLRTCYPQEVIDVYLDLFLGQQPASVRYRSPNSPVCDPARALAVGVPDLLVIERHNPHCQQAILQRRADWVMLYQDQLAQIWGRRDTYDDVTDDSFIPLSERRINDALQSGVVQWPATPGDATGNQRAPQHLKFAFSQLVTPTDREGNLRQ
jgi:hypothetical protein